MGIWKKIIKFIKSMRKNKIVSDKTDMDLTIRGRTLKAKLERRKEELKNIKGDD